MSCLGVLELIVTQRGTFENNQLAADVAGIKDQLDKGLKFYRQDEFPVICSSDTQKAFLSKLVNYLSTSSNVSDLMYKAYLNKNELNGTSNKPNLFNVTRTQQVMDEVRGIYWSERLGLIQLQKIMSSHWEASWYHVSDLLFGATKFQSHFEFMQLLIDQFVDLYRLFVDLLNKNFTTKTQIEISNESKLIQLLREIVLTLEALLISLCGNAGASKASGGEIIFSSLLESFWESLFFARKELLCLSASCREIVDRIRSLQCFVLIKAGRLDDVCLYESGASEKGHFVQKSCSRLLACVSSINKVQGNAPLLLLAAVCGAAFASSLEELDKANYYAFMAIRELDVFTYLCGILCESNSAYSTGSTASGLFSSDFLVIPESLSVVSFCNHLAVFDILTLLSRHIALDSLGSYRNAYTQVLAKTLSVVVQCSGNVSARDIQNTTVDRRINSVIEDVAQRFPLDLDLLYVCIALLNTGVNTRDLKNEEGVTNLVVQLISSVPYFAERCKPSLLNDIVRFHDTVNEDDEVTVRLLRPHWSFPPDGYPQVNHPANLNSTANPLAINVPAGTRGVLKYDGTVVVWHHEYSLWPVLNSIVISAEQTILLKQTENLIDRPSEAIEQNVMKTISRLVSCLDFVDICLLTKVEPTRCLAITEVVWNLVTRVFTEILSGERETHFGNLLANLSANQLLPCLLRLTAHCATLMLPSDTELNLAYNLSNGIFRCLQSDRILCPSVDLQFQRKKHLSGTPYYTLTDSCFLRIVSTSTSTSLWTAEVSSTTIYRLLSAYLDMALSLLSAEKTAFLLNVDSCFSGNMEDRSMSSENHSPILPCFIFCYEFLVEAGGNGPGLNIIPKLLVASPDANCKILHLVNKALLFFVELLTSYSLANGGSVSQDSELLNLNWPLLSFCDLRSYGYYLLANSEIFLNCIISLTKIPVCALQMPIQSVDFDFLRFSTRPEDEQIGGISALGQYRVQSTWLALTLMHSLFPAHSTSPQPTTVLKTLSASDTAPYFLRLLDFLDPDCVVGLTRAAVSLLKKLIRFSDYLITPHLHDVQPRLINYLIQRLRPTSADHVTRTGLFDWLAEAVMYDVLNGISCAPFNGPGFGLLRMISSGSDVSNSDALQGIVVNTLQEVKEGKDLVSTNLYWSLLKLVSAIWMQPSNPFRIQFLENSGFWKNLSEPFFNRMSTLESETEYSFVDLEIAGSYAAIVAVELFESMKSVYASGTDFFAVCKQFIEHFFVPCLRYVFRYSDNNKSSESGKSAVFETLDWAVVRWKSLFCTILKWNYSLPDDRTPLISSTQIVSVIEICLEKATFWISLSRSREAVSIVDQLAICLATSARYLVVKSTPSSDSIDEWIERVVALLEHWVELPTSKSSNKEYSHFHSDLIAFICLLLPECSQVSSHLYDRLLSLCLDIFQDISLLPRISNVETQVFVQTVNMFHSIWTQLDTVKLATFLVNTGVINNLIAILAEYSTTFSRAEFCHTIVRLLTRFLLPDGCELSSDLSEVSKECSHLKVIHIFASYASSLVRALHLPPTQQLMQWLGQADKCKLTSMMANDDLFPNTAWSEFLLSQLRLVRLMVVQEGGAGIATPMAYLLKSFLLNNHEQLIALLAAPPKGPLIASVVLDLYWCAMHSSPAVTKLALSACVAWTVLFAEGRHTGCPPPKAASVSLPSDVWTSVYSAAVQLTQSCALLLLRPAASDCTKTDSQSSTLKSLQENSKASKLSVTIKLLPIVRLLNSCLRLITVELPLLGDLSFASSSEITALTPGATLNFATPTMEPSSSLTFGVLFSVARTSSQIIVDIHNSKPMNEVCVSRRNELLSLVVEANEMAFSLIYSQATILLANPRIDAADKHTLLRGLAVEFQSYNFLGRSTRRGMKNRGCQTPVKNSTNLSRQPRDPSILSDSVDLSGPQLCDLLAFLRFTDRFSDGCSWT